MFDSTTTPDGLSAAPACRRRSSTIAHKESTMPRKLTPNFTYEEMIASQTAARLGIDNRPDAQTLHNLKRLCAVLERVRSGLGDKPIIVSSGFRCAKLNTAIKGSKTSYHMKGLAVDFTAPSFGTPLQTARAIAGLGIDADQIIHEYSSWVHVGLPEDGDEPRGELLSIGSQGRYVQGLTANC
jgi:zinc D-Ala-D-Ala carboxypeptidase